MKISVSAPGKLMLFGEHAILYNRPCLVTAVSDRMTLTLEESSEMKLPPGDTRFLTAACKKIKSPNVTITTKGFSSNFGLGSSSAVTVCMIKALSILSGKNLSNKELFDLSYQAVLDVQGKGSGFDVAAAVYGGTLYFKTGGSIIEPIQIKDMPLIVGYTGIKADTVTIMNNVAKKMAKEPEKISRIYDAITKLVEDAKKQMVERDWERVGKCMDFNQEYLRNLGVSSEKLEALIQAAKSKGAYGAKLSGAGGGDCMICVASKEKQAAIKKAIEDSGGQVIHIQPNAEGVRVEL
jgi:mevalonate kinase